MRVDASALASFYASPLGLMVQRMLANRVAAAWPDVAARDVLGVGFAAPLLSALKDTRRLVLAAPAGQGALQWPPESPSASVLVDEGRLPFMDAIFDRAVLVHVLEEADNPHAMLRELWRVMAPEGRVIVIVANRLSVWAMTDATPFGHGRPFSRRQLGLLLGEAMFEPMASARAVYTPPWGFAPLLKMSDGLEAVGERLWPALGGIILMEAVKRLHVRPGAPASKVVRAPAKAMAR